MAPIALLLVTLGLERVDGYKVAPMAFGFVITTGAVLRQFISGAAAFVAVKAPFLIVALGTVVTGFACQYTVATYEVGVMVQGDSFGFMATVALFDGGVFKFGMGGLLFGI
jgi:hypothetical protein